MPGRIRILADKIDDVVSRFHDKFIGTGGRLITVTPWERGVVGCLCMQCKSSHLKKHQDTAEGIKVVSRDKYAPKGRTYKDQIERSLEGEEYRRYVYDELTEVEYGVVIKREYIVYEWE